MATITVGASGTYGTIQAAINAAAAGDTISVASGTYNEQLLINGASNLTIKAATGATVTVQAPGSGLTQNGGLSTQSVTPGRPVVALASVVGSTNVKFEGITFDGQHNSTGIAAIAGEPQLIGVYYQNSSGGIDHVDVKDISDPLVGGGPSGVQRGIGVLVDNSSLKAFSVEAGTFSGFQKNGMYFKNATVDIAHATITGAGATPNTAQNGIVLFNSGGTIHDNTITGIGYVGTSAYTGHILSFDSTNLSATNNTIIGTNGANAATQSVGIYFTNTTNGTTLISGNTISGVDTGIEVDNTPTGVTVSNNNISALDPNDTYFSGASAIDFANGTASGNLVSGNSINLTGATVPLTFNFTELQASDFSYNAGSNTWTVKGVTVSSGQITDHSGDKFMLVTQTGASTSVQAAITAGGAGATVLVAPGTYTESLAVTGGVSILGVGANVIVQATTNSNAISISGNLGGADVTIKGVTLQGVAGVNGSVTSGAGLYVAKDANVGKLTVDNATVKDGGGYGVLVNGDTTMNAVGTLQITNSTFSNNGYNGTNGSGHIKLFGFDGNATLANLTLTGGNTGIGTPAVLPDYAIEFTGQPNPGPNPPSIGNVSIQNVTVSGDFHKSGLALWNYANLTNLNLASVNLSAAQTYWTPVFHTDGITSATQNASGWGLILPTRDHVTEIQGDIVTQPASNQTITGTAFNDWIMGKGGNDTLIGGGGDDYLYGADKPGGAAETESSNDTLIGGAGNDYLFGGNGDDTAVFTGVRWQYTVTETAPGEITVKANYGNNGTDVVTGVEFFQFADGVLSAAQVLVPVAEPADPNPGSSTPPPPNSGQGPSEQAAQGFENVTGNDADSTKSTSPTTTLPDGTVVPNESYQDAQQAKLLQQQYAAGQITKTQLVDALVDMAIDTTGVALNAYQFFTGATPTTQGLAYLVNSPSNPNDLTDPYYAKFNDSNLYINFAVNLGTAGEGSANFAANYGSLSFEDAIRKAYNEIIGNSNAQAKGINIDAAVQGILAQQSYFNALGGTGNGAKAAMVGYLMYEGMKGHVGKYYDATHNYLEHAFDGTAGSNVNMLTSKLVADVDLFQ